MLRMYSVMQLQQVWQKPEEVHQPEEEVLSPSLPVVQEEEEDEQQQKITEDPVVQDTSAATATSDAAEDVAIVAKEVILGEPVFVEEPMTITEPAGIEEQPAEEPTADAPAAAAVIPAAAKETITVESKTKADNDNSEDNKRDSKISTGSTSLLPQTLEDKVLPATASTTLASRATSIRTIEEHQHPSPPTPKVSRSSQIQAKLSTQRKNFSRKLKRTFSMSSTKSNKSQTL